MTAPHSAASPTGSSTVAGILILAALTLFFEVDIGFAAITVGLVLMLISPQLQKGAIGQISWPGEMPCEGWSEVRVQESQLLPGASRRRSPACRNRCC
jgi:hypothetical protein